MKELFTIGEIGRLFQMNIRTLRYYDQIGLLRPEKVDLKTGYRFYSTKQFERLNTIKYLRDLDVPIEKIIRFFENKDAENLMELLEEQREDIQLMKSRLDRIERKLERRITQLSDALSSKLYVIWEVNIPKRKIAFLRREIPLEEDLEYPIRELEQIRHLEPMMFLGKSGSICGKRKCGPAEAWPFFRDFCIFGAGGQLQRGRRISSGVAVCSYSLFRHPPGGRRVLQKAASIYGRKTI